ncbi:MAG TPA: thiolase family protein [Pseudolysinimonas sp.]|nr:thiolase family protein [Pseudolysinimonas sp.]
MSRNKLVDRTAITGVGWTPMVKKSGVSVLTLAVDASLDAIADAGLVPTDIDGLVTYFWGIRDTPAPAQMAEALGLTSCNMSFCDGSGGAWAAAAIAAAAMAVQSGMCRNVLVYRAANARSEPSFLPGMDTWHSGQRQWNEPFGAAHPATLYGPHVSAWMHNHKLSNLDLAPLAVLQRGNAALNRKALMTEPMTVADHQASPWIVEPFRLLDCSVWNDGAVALVVSATHDARHGPSSVVSVRAVSGGTIGAPVRRNDAAAHWELNASVLAPALYEQAGIRPSDIDIAEVYDPFTGVALMHVEQFGLVEPGSSPARIRHGEFALDAKLSVNTNGGHLSEGSTAGLGHVVEAVQQLRAGGVSDDFCTGDHDYDRRHCRQVRDPEFALVVGESGDSALILRRQ